MTNHLNNNTITSFDQVLGSVVLRNRNFPFEKVVGWIAAADDDSITVINVDNMIIDGDVSTNDTGSVDRIVLKFPELWFMPSTRFSLDEYRICEQLDSDQLAHKLYKEVTACLMEAAA